MSNEQEELEASFEMCPHFKRDNLEQLHKDMQDIKAQLTEMHDVLVMWQDAKTFFKIVRALGELAKWAVATGIAAGALYYYFSGKKP